MAGRKEENDGALDIGTVISIPERKRNIYKITDIKRTNYRIHRCENDPKNGYPLASDRTTYMYPIAKVGIQVIGKGKWERTPLQQYRASHSSDEAPNDFKNEAVRGILVSDLKKNVFVPNFVVEAFLSLENALSPENLCCDGELRGSALTAKKAKIDNLWKALEGYINMKVRAYV
jgi:hypothetical protein